MRLVLWVNLDFGQVEDFDELGVKRKERRSGRGSAKLM